MGTLFREEALKAGRGRLLGDVVIAQPIALRVLVLFIAVMVICIFALATSVSYARKETVVGYVSPADGIVRVNANQPGVISNLLVAEGDVVEAGTLLLTIRSSRVNEQGINLSPQMIRSIDDQLRELKELEKLVVARNRQQARQFAARVEALKAEEQALQNRFNAQRRLIEITTKNLDRVRQLAGEGHVSIQDLAAKEEALIANEQLLFALSQEIIAVQSEMQQAVAAIDQLPIEMEEKQSELRSRRADLDLRRLQLAGEESLTIVAPVAGTVSAAVVVMGDSVVSQQHLLTLLPTGSTLEAHLYVPTRAIGFVTGGQDVRILYDAFDYRRYGVQQGRVREVASAMLSATETYQRVQLNEPSYQVRVELSEQLFRSKHDAFALQPGMTLRADIVLERRTLLSWLANPILALKGRT